MVGFDALYRHLPDNCLCLEFPMTTRLTLPASKNLTVGGTMPSVALISQTLEMALVAYAMEQVNQARKSSGKARCQGDYEYRIFLGRRAVLLSESTLDQREQLELQGSQ